MKSIKLITVFLVVFLTLSCKETKKEEHNVTNTEEQIVVNKKLNAADFKSNIA